MPPVLEVNTKMFNFSSDGATLSIDLFEGVAQYSAQVMPKNLPFSYVAANRPALKPMVNKKTMEFPTGKFENASEKLLQAKDVENLRAVDLEVMKNSIYARHGRAFEDPRLTSFFVANKWYSPVFTMVEVAEKLTETELKNIRLIDRFDRPL